MGLDENDEPKVAEANNKTESENENEEEDEEDVEGKIELGPQRTLKEQFEKDKVCLFFSLCDLRKKKKIV